MELNVIELNLTKLRIITKDKTTEINSTSELLPQ